MRSRRRSTRTRLPTVAGLSPAVGGAAALRRRRTGRDRPTVSAARTTRRTDSASRPGPIRSPGSRLPPGSRPRAKAVRRERSSPTGTGARARAADRTRTSAQRNTLPFSGGPSHPPIIRAYLRPGGCRGYCGRRRGDSMRRLVILLAVAAVWIVPAKARQGSTAGGVFNATNFRNIGPFRTAAWITEIAVPDSPQRDHLYTIYAASRTGGLWKTTNNGVTWTPISDSVDVAAVGAVAVSSSNPNIVWMGTGDQAHARSSYSGRGVYKSIDAGKSWQLMGLPDSHHIARIVIHPTNPDIVYVAAMGHLFSRNEERGVFRTRNGGKTWDKVLYADDGTGAIDLVMNRKSPDTLYAAMYEKHRTPWQLTLGGPGTGVYRTDDGGTKWRKLEGLPSGNVGRIGLDISPRNPNLLTIIVENLNPRKEGMPARVDACQVGAPARGGGGAGRGGRGSGGPIGNEVYRSEDGGKTWKKTHGDDVDVAGSKAPYSFNQIKTNPADPNQIIVNS